MCPSKKEGGGGARRQLTYQDRVDIEAGLNRGDALSTIARTIGRAPKVVAAEVRRNWTDEPKGRLTVTTRNLCVHRSEITFDMNHELAGKALNFEIELLEAK